MYDEDEVITKQEQRKNYSAHAFSAQVRVCEVRDYSRSEHHIIQVEGNASGGRPAPVHNGAE